MAQQTPDPLAVSPRLSMQLAPCPSLYCWHSVILFFNHCFVLVLFFENSSHLTNERFSKSFGCAMICRSIILFVIMLSSPITSYGKSSALQRAKSVELIISRLVLIDAKKCNSKGLKNYVKFVSQPLHDIGDFRKITAGEHKIRICSEAFCIGCKLEAFRKTTAAESSSHFRFPFEPSKVITGTRAMQSLHRLQPPSGERKTKQEALRQQAATVSGIVVEPIKISATQ